MIETITEIYATHPFAVILSGIVLTLLVFIKFLSFVSRIVLIISAVAIVYYFWGMTPENQEEINNQTKIITTSKFESGSYDTSVSEGLRKKVGDKIREVGTMVGGAK